MRHLEDTAAFKVLWILLGVLVLIPGLLKLFMAGPSAVATMLSGIKLFSWAPLFWAWILIAVEIISGALILARWKLRYTTIPPMIVLLVAVLFVTIQWNDLAGTAWSAVLLHLVAIGGYWFLGSSDRK